MSEDNCFQSEESSLNESILYEVLEYFIKKQEPQLLKSKNEPLVFPTPGTIKNALKYLNNRYSLPESISQQVACTLPWKFAIGDKGRILAILQENIIEIRKSKDEYSSIIGKASAPKDAFPQWRKLAWSPDGSILALASSNGYVSFYNSFGNNIFNICPKSLSQDSDVLEAGDATVSMIFKKPRVKSETWNYEFIRVTYSGLLNSYCISGNEFSENHIFSFGNYYRNGISSVSYSEKHNLFFVAGNIDSQHLSCLASQTGLTCWRTLNDHPYYKLSVSSQDINLYKSHFSIWNFIPIIKNKTQSIIFKTSISPNEELIVCLHTDGVISIWSLPTLKLQNQWKLHEQPDYEVTNPLKTVKLKKLNNLSEFQPLDIGWWSEKAVIIARYSGAISVCSINNLENLLGTSPEFLYSHPQIAELDNSKGFLCLDCEMILARPKKKRESTSEGSASELSDSEKDEDEMKPISILDYMKDLIKNVLYSITDDEKFQPKRKKSKIFYRTYRLVGIKSTTPEELYARKIEIEEYEEALTLAKTYNLDPDLVYQTQWRKSEFTVYSIKEHLSKVSKRSWVLNECVSRVPESIEAARELLNFGLEGANLETLVAIGDCDDGKFISSDLDVSLDNLKESSTQLMKMKKINKVLDAITKNPLTESQKELLRYRKQLLNHLDKLKTYETLLDSPVDFDKEFYEKFRLLSPVENAVKFAKNANFQGVKIMFTYYGSYLIPHWLMIVSYFPETLNPENYKELLPECDLEGRLFLLDQQELRPNDWVERSDFSDIINLNHYIEADYLYEEKLSYLTYRNKDFTQELLQKWYKSRAYEIEHFSRLVDNALALVNIGKAHNVEGLETLIFDLETLDDLVYKVGMEDLSLTDIDKLNDLEKIKLLMAKADEKNFVNYLKTMILPYSRRRRRYNIGINSEKDVLYEYLVFISKNSLEYLVPFFEFLKTSFDSEILDNIKCVNTLAADCIYNCEDIEMYPKAKAILDATSIHLSGREDNLKAHKELEKELKCLQILNKYEVKVPLHQIKESRHNPSNATSLLIQMSENLIEIYSYPRENNWSQLLNDMLDIQEQAFSCVDIESCFELSMIARLKSKSKEAIQGCTKLIELNKTGRSRLKVPYEKAVDFVLEASNNYFNNSKSLTDTDMELARECLQLITTDDKRVKEEYDLIESLQILNDFNINILPVQVRMTQDRLKLIEDCINNKVDAYKNKHKLLNLSKYLAIEPKNNKLREGKVFKLIAKKSYEIKDYNFCSSVLKQMIKNNYQAGWTVALDLASCSDYEDLNIRWECIWFTISNGPSDMIEDFMKLANLLQVQILNSDLQKLLPPENEDVKSEEDFGSNLENELKMSSFEDKEFMPKIVQTSTDLVKSSAQIVTQSTFDLLRNAGNSDFWKSKLSFNFLDSKPKDVDQSENVKLNSAEKIQKFFCFYETLHDNFGISDLETKYDRYSTVDYNVKLKLCQTLLRISLLSETASYGKEISDVNHLLLDCAEYTIPEDCILGFNYVLNINEDELSNIENLFKNAKCVDLYSQILAYFHSVLLYLQINSGLDDVFQYDPINLTHHMASVTIDVNNDVQKKLQEMINLMMNKKKKIINKDMEISEDEDENESCSEDAIKACIDTKNNFEIKTKSETADTNKSTQNHKNSNLNFSYQPDGIDVWTDTWGEDWGDTLDPIDEMNNLKEIQATKSLEESLEVLKEDNLLSNVNLTNYSNYFEDKFSKIQGIDDYKDIKEILLHWANFNNFSVINFKDEDSNLSLKIICILASMIPHNINSIDMVCQEVKDFLKAELLSPAIIVDFVHQKGENLLPELLIYLQLCSKDLALQERAIQYIKENHKNLILTPVIFEEIFFNNLTSSFGVSHDLYYKILEIIFENFTTVEIKNHIKLLIRNLIDQRNIPHAIALLNQLEGVPPALSTYDNCFKILMKKKQDFTINK